MVTKINDYTKRGFVERMKEDETVSGKESQVKEKGLAFLLNTREC